MEDNQLTKINSFTRRSFSADEVYVFDVILCDNEIDRDSERFSHEALLSLKELFVGKTGISDHNPKSENQLARIFDTELIKDDSRKTSYGQPYEYLKASVYMVRTEANKDLIAEIDGGIKKEVSISCSAGEKICSVCGCDKNKKGCAHVKGKTYNGKPCHNILGGVSDAYEWSFVAVPAQVNAGVTKRFAEKDGYISASVGSEALKIASDDIRRDIVKLAFFCGGESFADSVCKRAENLGANELVKLKRILEKRKPIECSPILFESKENEPSLDNFIL